MISNVVAFREMISDTEDKCIKVHFYKSAEDLVLAHLIYVYIFRSVEGTVFDEQGGGLCVTNESMQRLLDWYRSDLRFGGLLQFLMFVWQHGIDLNGVRTLLGVSAGREKEFSDIHEFEKYANTQMSYCFNVIEISSDSGWNITVQDLSSVEDFILLLSTGADFGLTELTKEQYDTVIATIQESDCCNYLQFETILQTLSKSLNYHGVVMNGIDWLELCLVHLVWAAILEGKVRGFRDLLQYI